MPVSNYHTPSLPPLTLCALHSLCTEKATGDQYAVKIVSQRHRPTREVNILQLCQGHPNIVHVHEVLSDEVSGPPGSRPPGTPREQAPRESPGSRPTGRPLEARHYTVCVTGPPPAACVHCDGGARGRGATGQTATGTQPDRGKGQLHLQTACQCSACHAQQESGPQRSQARGTLQLTGTLHTF